MGGWAKRPRDDDDRQKTRPIEEIAAELAANVPPEDWANVPSDLSELHDAGACHKEIKRLRAENERLKGAEERDLLAIEQGLDRDDTLGASMRRQREEIERLQAAHDEMLSYVMDHCNCHCSECGEPTEPPDDDSWVPPQDLLCHDCYHATYDEEQGGEDG